MASSTGAVRAAPRKRIIGLDLGTHSCGISTSKARDQKPNGPILLHEAWPDQPCSYPKTRSALLYKGKTVVAWGWAAAKRLNQLSRAEAAEHWYIEDFKLAHNESSGDAACVAKAKEIRARDLTIEQVVTDYLKPFATYVKKELCRMGVPRSEIDQAQWCLTVPAMWSEASKALMRRAAKRAGLIRSTDDDALSIILEPEAAALHARHTNSPPLRRGMTVCVLDVGDGTADITVHDVIERGGQCVLAEAVSADGAMCGSQYVDMAFREYYRTRVGAAEFDTWVEQHPAEWRQVLDKWISYKHSSMPMSILRRLPVPPNLRGLVDPPRLRGTLLRPSPSLGSDIVLDQPTAESLFNGPVTEVVQAATKQLVKALELKSKRCDLVLLVGGFAQNPYLQSRVRAALVDTGLAKELVVPPHPYSAVLQGAVLYGCDPTLIHARRSRMAYGIRASVPWCKDAPPESKWWHDEECTYFSSSHFAAFVMKDELVAHDQVVTKTFEPAFQRQRSATIELYATDDNDARWIRSGNGFQILPDFPVQLSAPGADRQIKVDFHFGQTEIKVTAWDPDRGEKAHTQVKFATDNTEGWREREE